MDSENLNQTAYRIKSGLVSVLSFISRYSDKNSFETEIHGPMALCWNFHLTLTLPKDKNLDLSKPKAYADNKIDVTQNLKFVLGRIENIVGNGEIACYQHSFCFSPPCFYKGFFI